jgi:molybdopterin converting factor small subunit
MFAALREAAGEDETLVEAGPLPRVLDDLRDRYGELFSARLELCSVLVDGSAVARGAAVEVADGAEVALLPPVSGGAGSPRAAPRRMRARPAPEPRWARFVPPVVLAGVAAAALVAGPVPFALVVAAAAAGALLDLGGLLARSEARPVLLAAAVPGLGLPLGVAAAPEAGLALVPIAIAVLVIGAFVVVLGVRGRPLATLGGTMLAGVLVGLGAAALVLLRVTPGGAGWVLGLAAVAVAADASGAGLRRWAVVPSVWLEIGVPLAVAAVAAVGVWQALAPPFNLVTAMRFALVAALASVCGTRLETSLGQEARVRRDGRPLRIGQGRLIGALDAVLIGAPGAYLLARALTF